MKLAGIMGEFFKPLRRKIGVLRRIDASGLFWLLVSILAGFFYGEIFGVAFYFVFGISAFLCFVWQFKIWSWDLVINRQAAEWCRIHYPEYAGTPIVDLMLALARVLPVEFANVAPSSKLIDLVGVNDNDFISLREMLQCLVYEAGIRGVNCSTFAGATLDDAIQFVVATPVPSPPH